MDFSKMSDEELEQLISQNEKGNSNGWLQKAGNIAGKFNSAIESSRIPAFAGGLLQGAGDIGASLGNVIARPLGHPIPHPNLSKYIDNSQLSKMAFGAGELGAQIPAYASGAGALSKLGLTSGAGLSGRLAEGLASGALLGENKEGSRVEGAALGAVAPLAGAAIKKVASLKSKNIADKILKDFSGAETKASGQFKNVFKEASARKISNLDKIKADLGILEEHGDSKYLHSLKEFNNNPTLSNAHSAQSDLAKYAKRIGRPQNTLERKAKEEAKRLSRNLRDNIMLKFHRSGNTDLGLKYNEARQFFRDEVGPYLDSTSVEALKEGKLRPKNFADKIQNEESFMAKLGQHKNPEIEYRRKLKKAMESKFAPVALGTALGSVGVYGAEKMFK